MISEAELKEMEGRTDGRAGAAAWNDVPRLAAEVRRLQAEHTELRQAATAVVHQIGGRFANLLMRTSPSEADHELLDMAFTLANAIPGSEPCDNPKCDAGGVHPRCFKDGRWLDTGEEM